MPTPDADHGSPEQDYSGDSDEGEVDMAAEKPTEPRSGNASPKHKANASSKVAKDPTRPRRKKARRACFACQRAHLTCGDERPCLRCVKRGLGEHCMDGVRKKAKYLHDAPDNALMPGVGGQYPPAHMHNNRPVSVTLPSQTQEPPPSNSQRHFYSQAPSSNYFPPGTAVGPVLTSQDTPYNQSHVPISPPYSQSAALNSGPPSANQRPQSHMSQFSGPLFDPSDPALFNFDISSLNFGNHYGALELGMLGHMSSGAAEAAAHDNAMTHGNLYHPQPTPGSYGDIQGLPTRHSFEDGSTEWANAQSRNGSHTHTPLTTMGVHSDQIGHRHDSLNGPLAYAIGQGNHGLSTSASPASMDHHLFDNEGTPIGSVFASTYGTTIEGSPSSRLQPVQTSAVLRKRRLDAVMIYQSVNKPYNYVESFHRLISILQNRYEAGSPSMKKALDALQRFRPVLMSNASDLTAEDLVHAEKNLQRSLLTMQQSFAEVGTPCLICRRSGEVVGMNKEFEILTGWRRDVLLGKAPNLNVNKGPHSDQADQSSSKTQLQTSPPSRFVGRDAEESPPPVNILELMDEPSALQYLDDFADLAYEDPLGRGHRRVQMLRYLKKEDMMLGGPGLGNGKPAMKQDPRVRPSDGSIQQGEAAMRNLGANGLIDAMIMWHIKRDNFDMPMLVAMQIMPMLNT